MNTQTPTNPAPRDFIEALTSEFLILTGYGIHAQYSPLALQRCYVQYQQAPIPLRDFAQALIRDRYR